VIFLENNKGWYAFHLRVIHKAYCAKRSSNELLEIHKQSKAYASCCQQIYWNNTM